MSQLDGVLAVAANNQDANFRLTANSQAVILYALEYITNRVAWRDYPDEDLSDGDDKQITDLLMKAVDDAIREINVGAGMYAGMYMDYAGAIPLPTAISDAGWLVCDGSVLERAAYPDLFDAIGTLYNVGGESITDFRLPDASGVSRMGRGTFIGLAAKIGEASHVLTTAEMPIHSHGVIDPGHTHQIPRSGGGGGANPLSQAGTVNGGFTTQSANTGISLNSAGGGEAHNNIHPVIGCNVLIMSINP